MTQKKVIEICDDIVEKYGLRDRNKYACIVPTNIGDIYFFISTLTYYQKKYEYFILLITYHNSSTEQMIKAQIKGGATINYCSISKDCYDMLNELSQFITNYYNSKIKYFYKEVLYRNKEFQNWNPPKDVRTNLTRPLYDYLPDTYYKDKFSIIPGRTIFIVAISYHHSSLQDHFWISLIRILKLLNFKIVVNSKSNLNWGNDIIYLMPSLEELVPLCNCCGYFIGIRTGLSEIIALETTAQVTIIQQNNVLYTIEQTYPFIQSRKINYFIINNLRKSGFNDIDNYFTEIIKSHTSKPDISRKEISTLEWNVPDISGHRRSFCDKEFDLSQKFKTNTHIWNVKYATNYNKGQLSIFLNIEPSLDYEIHAALIDIKSSDMVYKQRFTNTNPIVFPVRHSGTYKIFIKIYNPPCEYFCWFMTKVMEINIDKYTELLMCVDYFKYINLLTAIKDNCIIFICSRDAHTNFEANKNLRLDTLGLAQSPEKKFRYSYIAIIDSGVDIIEKSSKNQLLEIEYKFIGNNAKIISAGYNVNNSPETPISIKINNIEEAVNKRGLNIVVWDKVQNELVDSIAFDTYLNSNVAYRNNYLYKLL